MESTTLHDHVVGFYERADELVAAVTSFATAALDLDGTAIVIATPAHRTAVEAALVANGVPAQDLIRSGRYVAIDAAATLAAFMPDDRIDREAFTTVMSELFDRTASVGPVHAFGEMVALLWDAGNVEAAIDLETLWNDLLGERGFSLYCAYPMAALEASGDLGAAKRVCDRHSDVVRLGAPAAARPALVARADGDTFARVFVPVSTVTHEVRTFVREVLGRCGEERCLAEAEVIVTELASNAILHARSPFRVSIMLTGAEIKIAVRDASTVPPENVHGHRHGGRGISIIAALSDSWATDAEIDGKTIWATLTRSA